MTGTERRIIRVELPAGLRLLAHCGAEVPVPVEGEATTCAVLDALEAMYPMLEGTIRDHLSRERRPFLRFFACREDISHLSMENALPEAVTQGQQPLIILGAIAGG